MSLEDYRSEIDDIDSGLVELIEKRLRVMEDLARFKYDEDLSVEDPRREQAVLAAVEEIASPDISDYVLSIFNTIIYESKGYQSQVMEELKG